jgi:fermentation-respiration switch protein FrsA (DUF1100 family)
MPDEPTTVPTTNHPRTRRLRIAVVIGVVAVLAGGCIGLEQRERELLFRPSRADAGWYSGVPADVQDVFLPVGADAGQRIHAWWWPDPHPRAPVVLYLHGARWNLTGHFNRIAQLRRFGFSVFAIDYRGFGRSDGDLPSETTVYEDARAAWLWLATKEPDPSRRYIYGHSLGGAVAVDLAAQLAVVGTGVGGLIIESSFTSLADIASELSNGWLPVGLLTEKFDSIGKIGQVRTPVLVVHGASDRYVPMRFSEALFAAAPAPKKLLLVQNGTHNNSMWLADADYRRALVEIFDLGAVLQGEAAVGPSPRAERTGS